MGRMSTSTATTPPAAPSRAARPDRPGDTSPVVLTAVCAAIAPLPFLAVYAVLFIVHALHPVGPPDVTNSRTGELIAGAVAVVAFALLAASVLSYLNAARRWPFLLLQAAVLATAIVFLATATVGGPGISAFLAAASALALVLGALPASAIHVDSPVGRRRPAPAEPPT